MEREMITLPAEEWEEMKGRVAALERQVMAIRLRDTDFLTVAEACELLRVSRTTLWRYRQEGKIHTRVIAGKMVISKTEVQEAINCGLI